MSKSENFFKEMVGFRDFSQFAQPDVYKPLPSEWYVVITDIVDSTLAIEQGKYKEVNSVSTASMIAVQNVFGSIELPFVFGGDGATLCIPSSQMNSVKAALSASRKLARQSFGLELRIGLVPVKAIEKKNLQVLIAKYLPSDHLKQAMFLGDGLGYAKFLVKEKKQYLLNDEIVPKGNFEGFECRWNEIPSPNEETISLMIKSLDRHVNTKKKRYEEILKKIDEIYGKEKDCHPLRLNNLSLTLSLKKLLVEARIRTPFESKWSRFKYLLKLLFLALAGKYLMSKGVKSDDVDWGQYKQNFIANTDYRKFDETLRMVICGTQKQRKQLVDYLTTHYQDKKIVFGVHESPGAIVTCMIKDYDKEHMHFLDGANGGYAIASKKMKRQLKELNL